MIPIDPKIMSFLFSLDGVGFDKDGNPILDVNDPSAKQWEYKDNVLWKDAEIREKILKPLLMIKEES